MKSALTFATVALALVAGAWVFLCSQPSNAADSQVALGAAAPGFELTGIDGAKYDLEQFRGEWVVLEWLNTDCPFVRKHYESGNMQKLQAGWTSKGVKWLSIVSSAPGKQGYMEPAEMKAAMKERKAAATAVLRDPEGTVGRLYGARTTPHMYVIDPEGTLVYMGAIDDQPSAKASSVAGAKNYVSQALTEAMAGNPVSKPSTQPYGCSVKYKS